MKRHILFLARWYPHRYDPMFGLFVQRHAEAVALFNDVSVVYVHQNNESDSVYELKQDFHNGVNAIQVYYIKPKSDGILSRFISAYRYCNAVFQGIKVARKTSGKPALIHVHVLTRLGLIALYYKVLFRIPYMVTEHWSRYLPGNKGFSGTIHKKVSALVVRNASMVTTVTENLAKAMQAHGLSNRKYVILPNVVDMQLFKPIENKSQGPMIRMVHVSCFEDQSKNISGMLRVLKRLKQANISFSCVMVGKGMDFEEMKLLRDSLELGKVVQFTGLLQGKQLAQNIAVADFMLMFSNYENMPVVILEAFACGIPVVATKVGGIPEMVDQKSGILVDVANEDALFHAILEMTQRLNEFNPQYLRDKVAEIYGTRQVGALLHSWYDEVVGGV